MLHKDSGRLHSPKKVNRRKQKLNYQNRKEASALFMQYKDEYVSLLFKTESDYKELKKLTFTALSDQKSALDVNVGFDSQQQSLKTLKHHYSSARPLLKEADQKALDEFHFNLIRMVLGDIINKRGKSLSKQICTEMIKECVSQNKTSASGFLHDLQEMKKMLITGSNADGSVQVNADSMKDYLYIIDLISTLGKNNEDKLVRSHSTPVLSMRAQ